MDLYKANKISDRLIVFGEVLPPGQVNAMALVIGDTKAALIDTGMGITGDLDTYVRQYTDLPIVVLCTHGDPDHIGACSLFETVYMSTRDAELLDWALSRQQRLADLFDMSRGNEEIYQYAQAHIVDEKRFAYKNIEDGDTFDLGGVVLEAIAVPGHTKGSMCFVNRAEQYVLTGDTIVPTPWLWIDRCTPIAEYVAAVRRFREMTSGMNTFYCGHSLTALPGSTVDDIIAAGEDIIAGRIAEDIPFIAPFKSIDITGMDVMQHKHGSVSIIYNRNRL